MSAVTPFRAVVDGVEYTSAAALKAALKTTVKRGHQVVDSTGKEWTSAAPGSPWGPGRGTGNPRHMWPDRVTLTSLEKEWLGATVTTPMGSGEVWCAMGPTIVAVVLANPHKIVEFPVKDLVRDQTWQQRAQQLPLEAA